MIATIPTSLLASLLFGLLFATAAQAQIRAATVKRPTGRVLAVVLLFETMIVWPVGLYFYLVHSDWTWMYFVDPRRLPLGIGVLVFAAYAVALLGGYGLGYVLVRKDQTRILYVAVVLILVANAGVAVLLWGRLSVATTYAGFPTHAVNISRVRLGYVLPATCVGVVAAFAFAAWQLWDQGRRQV